MDDLQIAHKLADIAQSISLSRFGAIDLKIITKPDLTPVSDADKHRTAEFIDDLCVPLALYLSFMSRPVGVGLGGVTLPIDGRDSGNAQLSQRQIMILRGMVEGKTNHELATELGFSVSTVRHETMRIFQALAVSDRKEAAKKALMLSLV